MLHTLANWIALHMPSQVDATLDTAAKATNWLQTGGGWAVAVLFLCLFGLVLRDRLRLEKDHKAELEAKDRQLYGLLQQQLDVLNKAVQDREGDRR